MAVLGKQQILERFNKSPAAIDSLVITPLLRPDDVLSDDAVDMRLGCYFLLPRLSLSRQTHFCPDREAAQALHMRLHVPLGKYLVVPAHQTVLGSTLEFIKLPRDVAGEILTKSSIARTFTLIETAPWVHPGYRGCLTLEIANVSNTPLLLYPGRTIGQLILMSVEAQTSPKGRENPKLSGKYLGPVYPEAPKFDDPADDLRKIGVADTDTLILPKPRYLQGPVT